jgi:hypothetical protein
VTFKRISFFFLVILAACSGGDPARVVEQYLQAKVRGDQAAMRPLLCAALEKDLEREALSFSTVTGVKIEGMACGRDGDKLVVRCSGKIIATYGAENTEFPLTAYQIAQEGGEWKWCGETQ